MSSKKSAVQKPAPAKKAVAKPAVQKPAPAKKVVAKPAAKKPAPAKKVVAKPAPKKPSPAKKAVAKPAPKKPVPAKKAVAKPAPKKPVPAKKTAEAKPAAQVAETVKKASVKKTMPAVVVPKNETTEELPQVDLNFAFSFAEQMKREHRADEEARAAAADGIRLSRRPTSRTKGSDSLKFPEADLQEFRKRLILLRQEATGISSQLKTVALEQDDERGGEDDDGSDVFMRLQNLEQVDSRNKVVQKIDEALHRIADGTYGVCEVCGQLIRKPRLLNMPFAHTCMECQCAMESPNAR